MLRSNLLLSIFLLVSIYLHAQRPVQLDKLLKAANSGDQSLIDKHWATLVAQGQPIVWGDSVAFVYRGNADSVFWNGDFNSWGRASEFQNKGTKIGATDIWILRATFPTDARLDYKINVNGNWMIDPNNKFQQWTGYGGGSPNSELRMPDWKASVFVHDKATQKGTLSSNKLIKSDTLNYEINVRYYTPFGYDRLNKLPVIYVTDGHEYANQKYGAMVEILDNLIEQKKIQPIIAVFIDPSDVNDPAKNRRSDELVMNPAYAYFLKQELIPITDKNFKASKNKNDRAIIGTSLGGIFATYIAVTSSEIFGKVAIQSPAYWYTPQIFDLAKHASSFPTYVSITTGKIHDTRDDAQKMKAILVKKSINLQYIEVNEGHSWGNWRALIDDQLIFLFPYN